MERTGKGLSTLFKDLRRKISPANKPGSSKGDQSSNDSGKAIDIQPGVSVATGDIASTQPENRSPTEPYGLFEFSPRPEQPILPSLRPDAQCVDVIAVHGLGGSWQTTWTAPNGNGHAIWLRDRLPIVLAQINVRPRILAFGYDSSYVFTSSASDLETCAEDLLTRIRIARQTEEEQRAPIIFIAHSLGGLVAKLAINIAHTDDEYHRDVLKKTAGCLFLAVPFHGSDAASWARLGSQIVSTLSLGMAGNPGLPNALKRNSKDWMKISRDFVQRGKNMTFRSGYETEKIGRSTIVDEASVRNNVPNERVFPVPGSNHRNICKFGDDENERFGPIGLAVTELVQAALDDLMSNFPIMSELPIATPIFYGRTTELKELSSTLDPSKLGRKGIVLFGIGGSGKTQLALKYAKENSQLYKAVFWINAFTSEQIKQSFTEAFHLISKSWPAKDLPNPYTGDNVQNIVLARLRSTLNRSWLLIIDSADDLNNQNLIQLLPDCTHGSIIVTSTRRDASDIFEPYGFSSIEIDKLDDDSGKRLLLHKAKMSSPLQSFDGAMAIVKELGGIPLALEQAGILLRKRIVNFDNFVEEYRSQYNELMGYLPRVGEVQHDKTRSMNAIFTILYSYIQKESPTAAAILWLLGVLGPSHVPVSILLDIIRLDPLITDVDPDFGSRRDISSSASVFRLHLSLLEDVCLVKTKLVSNELQELVILHRAICQWITTASVSHKAQRIIFTARALGEALCRGEKTLAWPMGGTGQYSYLSRICLAWVDRIRILITESIDCCDIQPPNGLFAPDYAKIALNFGYVYFCNARYKEAISTLSRAHEYTALQPETDDNYLSDAVYLYYCLGFSSFKTGDLIQAKKFLEAASENPDRMTDTELANAANLLRGISNGVVTSQRHHTAAVAAACGPKAPCITHSNSAEQMNGGQKAINDDGYPKDIIAMNDCLYHTTEINFLRWGISKGHKAYIRDLLQMPTSINHTFLDEAFSLALYYGYNNIVGLILEYQFNVKSRSKLYATPSRLVYGLDLEYILRLFLEYDADIEATQSLEEYLIHDACSKGDKELFELLLDRNANIEAPGVDQCTPLHEACSGGHMDIVQLLLDRNANIEAKENHGGTPLFMACGGGHYNIVQLLLDRGAKIDGTDDDGDTTLHIACAEGHHDIVQLLLDNNAEINKTNDNGNTGLQYAYLDGHYNVVQLLLDRGAKIDGTDDDGDTTLRLACLGGNHDVVRLSLDKTTEINKTNDNGKSDLHVACKEGNYDVVRLLLDNSVEINRADDDGDTALHLACIAGNHDVVQLLVLNNAEIDKTNSSGNTPLFEACLRGYFDIVRLLLDHNAQVDMRNHAGDTPLDAAVESGRRDVAKILKEYEWRTRRKRVLLIILKPDDE